MAAAGLFKMVLRVYAITQSNWGAFGAVCEMLRFIKFILEQVIHSIDVSFIQKSYVGFV